MQGKDGKFYIQHCCPFGSAASESNSGQVSRSILRIWTVGGIDPNGKWSDDVYILVYPVLGSGTTNNPWIYPYNEEMVLEAVASTGTPFHPLSKKGQRFLPDFDYMGMWWSLRDRTVGFREAKRRKYLHRTEVSEDLARRLTVSEQECMTIHGSLCHLAFVHRAGRSRLSSLLLFIAKFHKKKYRRGQRLHAPPSVVADMAWWASRLRTPNFARELLLLGEVRDMGISVDASTCWGIGIKWGDGWDAWKVKEGWKGPGRDIGWLKCLAIKLLVCHLEIRGYHDCCIRLLSDNQGIIGAYWKGWSRNKDSNYSIRRFMNILDSLHILLDVLYIASAENPADPISQGELGPRSLQLRPSIKLPEELLPYLTHV